MLDKNDEKKLVKIVGQVIDEKVTPRLERVEEKIDVTMEMCAKNSEDITDINGKVSNIEEKTDDLQAATNRIETLAKSEIKYVDDLSKRVVVLETKKA